MNILFICTKNRIRSLTAEHMLKNHPQHQVRSAGTGSDARRVVGAADLQWAEIIFVMEKKHVQILEIKFPELVKTKEIICLNIPNGYEYMDDELVSVLRDAMAEYVSH